MSLKEKAIRYIYSRKRKGILWRMIRGVLNRERLKLMPREKDYLYGIEVSEDGLQWKEVKHYREGDESMYGEEWSPELMISAGVDFRCNNPKHKYVRVTIEV